jgi:hypothetical protein
MKQAMRRLTAFAVAMLWAGAAARAATGEPPYAKLANVLGTPKLAYSQGPKDKSQLLLKFVPDGETATKWSKMTTISILKVPEKDTESAGRGVIAKLRDLLKSKHAKIQTFDESPIAPFTCYFVYTVEGSTQKGIVYEPALGFVTVAQVGAKYASDISHHDALVLKGIIHEP